MKYKLKDLTGQRFGRLLVKSLAGKNSKGLYTWNCLCDCGNEKVILAKVLGRYTHSCGCLRNETMAENRTSHNLSKSPLYKVWLGMKSRCTYKQSGSYRHYGGRGIKVCKKWMNNFENFYNDMIEGYRDGMTIERKNVNGNYTKSNCVWATMQEQGWNKRTSRIVKINGEEKCVSEWALIMHINPKTIFTRLDRGYSDYDSIFGRPPKRNGGGAGKKKVINTLTKEVYKSLSEAAIKLKIPLSSLSHILNGRGVNNTHCKIIKNGKDKQRRIAP